MRVDSYSLDISSQHEYFSQTIENITEIGAANASSIGVQVKTSQTNEKERLSLDASGTLKSDSVEIVFKLQALEFRSEVTNLQMLTQLKDPLVINLRGKLPKTTDSEKIEFDIDSDGKADRIASLESGNGFLALDKNKNGKIDNGGELFGTASGNGFADLAKYDEDSNGVIDENDSVFKDLKIWHKNAYENRLFSLKDDRVGALLLQNVDSQFDLRDGGELSAKLQKSGVAIFEDGRASWMSHVDFVIESKGEEPKSDTDNQTPTSTIGQAISPQNTSAKSNIHTVSDDLVKMLKQKLKEIESKLANADEPREKDRLSQEKLRLVEQIAAVENAGL